MAVDDNGCTIPRRMSKYEDNSSLKVNSLVCFELFEGLDKCVEERGGIGLGLLMRSAVRQCAHNLVSDGVFFGGLFGGETIKSGSSQVGVDCHGL